MSESSFGDYPNSQPLQALLASPKSTLTSYGVLSVILIYYILHYLDYTNIPLSDLLWNTFVYIMPLKVLALLDKDYPISVSPDAEENIRNSDPRTHAGKSDAMRRVLGLQRSGIMDVVQRTRAFSSLGGIRQGRPSTALPGLGNWDNSCYQNSVLQGLASLDSLPGFLAKCTEENASSSTMAALNGLTAQLNDEGNMGRTFWTPAKLKNMSSWQQQDAQEYFSKVLDEIEREMKKNMERSFRLSRIRGWPKTGDAQKAGPNQTGSSEPRRQDSVRSDAASKIRSLPDELQTILTLNPLEGHLAQRVGCQRCGYVEGLTLVPFNCLTVPLGKEWLYDIRACLDEFTSLELINGVECAKCTLLQAEKHMVAILEKLKSPNINSQNDGSSQRETRLWDPIRQRLKLVRTALEDGDFTDQLLKKCQIGPKNRVSTTKSRQAVIARAPKALAIHVNRSVFNEHTGIQSKNYADVRFPRRLGLGPWCLGHFPYPGDDKDGIEHWNTNPSQSLLSDIENEDLMCGPLYELRAVITHYGRHENGHYICYRRSPRTPKPSADDTETGSSPPWWRLSDEDVTQVTEENVLAQGGVFMLFYEQIETPRSSRSQLTIVPNPVEYIAEKAVELTELELPQEAVLGSSRIPQLAKEAGADQVAPIPAQITPSPLATDDQESLKDEVETVSPPSPGAASAVPDKDRKSSDHKSTPVSAAAMVSVDHKTEQTEQDPQEAEDTTISDPSQSIPPSLSSSTQASTVLPASPSFPIANARVADSEGQEARTESRSLPSTSTISPRTGRRSVSRAEGRAMMESVAGFVQAN